jgi:hypothetical protein
MLLAKLRAPNFGLLGSVYAYRWSDDCGSYSSSSGILSLTELHNPSSAVPIIGLTVKSSKDNLLDSSSECSTIVPDRFDLNDGARCVDGWGGKGMGGQAWAEPLLADERGFPTLGFDNFFFFLASETSASNRSNWTDTEAPITIEPYRECPQ